MIQIKVINTAHHPLPEYKTIGSSGMDIYAFIKVAIELMPLERKLVPTGLFFEIPLGYEIQIRPRSGLAIKNGITLINSPGTIDSDYRGEIKIPVVNLSNETHIIKDGDRIAQMILAKHEVVDWIPVEKLEDSKRGIGGFGHTGR